MTFIDLSVLLTTITSLELVVGTSESASYKIVIKYREFGGMLINTNKPLQFQEPQRKQEAERD